MGNWLTSGGETPGLLEMDRTFCGMLEDGRHIFDAAANALVGGTDPEAIRQDLFSTDARINAAEQQIRRQIVVHGTVHGARSFPSLLVLMSLAKDAERIGDYAKNLFDLAVLAPDLGGDEEVARLVSLKDRISEVLGRTRAIYEAQEAAQAREALELCGTLQDECDANLVRAVRSEGCGAGLALASRYMKRVSSHTGNVLTSLVMPLHKIDFYDEPKGS